VAKSSTKESATNKKWLLAGISFVLFVSFIGVGVIGYRRIAPARAARRAGMLLEKGDYRSASLSAQLGRVQDHGGIAGSDQPDAAGGCVASSGL
jgi:hypothetical protein